LVIRRTDLLTVNTAAALAQYAKEGLPVIISDGIPTQIASTTGLAQAQSILKGITLLPNFHQVTIGPLASTLQSVGIQPLTKTSANSTSDTHNIVKALYVFVYDRS
jgi:hypothetical protein